MAYRTLLAHLSNEQFAAATLNVATLLAENHAAHLIGLHITPPLEIYAPDVLIPVDLTRQYTARQEAGAERIRAMFAKATDAQTHVAEWRAVDASFSSVSQVLIEQSNTSDLLVIGQSEGDLADPRFKNLPEDVLMSCGRPVLVVPNGDTVSSVGQRVLVAWDGRRESTRALFGALPLLRRAETVRLHRINAPHQDRHHHSGITEELANTVARHGVALEVCHSDARSSEIGDELIGYANDMDADLLVMGCYGHSPIREFLLGGTTRQILGNPNVPVLMSN